MNAAVIAKVALAVARVAVSVDDGKDESGADYVRAYVLGIPVFDTRWEGVRKRRARREARRAKR
jgi:hypothetical protein